MLQILNPAQNNHYVKMYGICIKKHQCCLGLKNNSRTKKYNFQTVVNSGLLLFFFGLTSKTMMY